MRYQAVFDTEILAKKIANAIETKCDCRIFGVQGGWCVTFEAESIPYDFKQIVEALGFKEVLTPDELLFIATVELRIAKRRLELAEKEYEEAMKAVRNQVEES